MYFGSCCLLVFMVISIWLLLFEGVFFFFERCDVNIILGDCDWLVLLLIDVWRMESDWLYWNWLVGWLFVEICVG